VLVASSTQQSSTRSSPTNDARVVSLLAAEQMQPTLYRIAVRNSAKLYEF